MAPKIDFTTPLATPLTGPTGGSPQNATSSTMTPGERQRRWNANNLDVNGGLRSPANSPNNTSGVVEDDVSGVDAKGSRNSPPPPPRSPSEEQRYNSATRAYNTVVAENNPRGLGQASKIRQSHQNIVAGSLQAKMEADRARGAGDPWTGWGAKRAEIRPVLHSMKGADGTTYYQQVDGKAGTARYWSVDPSGNRTEYTGDDKVSARDQINAARKNADLEAKKNYWRSKGVQFGETDEKGNFTGKFEKKTAEGARAEHERLFGKQDKQLQEMRLAAESAHYRGDSEKANDITSVANAMEDSLDKQKTAWSQRGEGNEQYNWLDKTQQVNEAGLGLQKVDWDAAAAGVGMISGDTINGRRMGERASVAERRAMENRGRDLLAAGDSVDDSKLTDRELAARDLAFDRKRYGERAAVAQREKNAENRRLSDFENSDYYRKYLS